METTEHLSELVTIVINETKTSRDAINSSVEVVKKTDETFAAINNTVGQIHEAMVHVKHAISDIEGVATDMAASTEEQGRKCQSSPQIYWARFLSSGCKY